MLLLCSRYCMFLCVICATNEQLFFSSQFFFVLFCSAWHILVYIKYHTLFIIIFVWLGHSGVQCSVYASWVPHTDYFVLAVPCAFFFIIRIGCCFLLCLLSDCSFSSSTHCFLVVFIFNSWMVCKVCHTKYRFILNWLPQNGKTTTNDKLENISYRIFYSLTNFGRRKCASFKKKPNQ